MFISTGSVDLAVLSLSPRRQGGSEVTGVVGYVGDIAYSLRHFMDVYSPSVPLAVEAGLLDRCVTVSCHVCVCHLETYVGTGEVGRAREV